MFAPTLPKPAAMYESPSITTSSGFTCPFMHEAGALTSGATKGAASEVVSVDASDDVDAPELGMVELPDCACEPLWGAFDPDAVDEPELDSEPDPEDCEDPEPEAWFVPEVLVGTLVPVSELPHPMAVTTPRATTTSTTHGASHEIDETALVILRQQVIPKYVAARPPRPGPSV